MKSLRESLLDDDLVEKTDEYIKDEIKKFLKLNYKGYSNCKISREPNQYGKYEVSSAKRIEVKNKNITSLTNGIFIWTTVDGLFSVIDCYSLKSLEGAPEKVGGDFDCSYCNSLESLKGAPKEVKGFYCVDCRSLKTLKGAPEKVRGNFNCDRCNSLTSLEGVPKEINGSFNCAWCLSLKSLEGAPKKVGGDFNCYGCLLQFTKDDVKKVSDVKGKIKCKK